MNEMHCTFEQLLAFCLFLSGAAILMMVGGMAAMHLIFKWLRNRG